MAKHWTWFGVKTLYRIAPVGRRLGTDAAASSTMTLVEERVVLFKAATIRIAIRKAEREARSYASDLAHRNPYGQRVRIRYLGYRDAYDINEPVVDGTEVYATNEVVPRRIPDSVVRARMIGKPESRHTYASRRNILHIFFVGAAPGVKMTAEEQETYDDFTRRLTSARRRRRARASRSAK